MHKYDLQFAMEQNKEINDNMKLEGLVQLLDMGVSKLKQIMLMKEKMWKVIEPSLATSGGAPRLSSLEWKIAKELMYLCSRGSSFCLKPTIQARAFLCPARWFLNSSTCVHHMPRHPIHY
jgi:hypothetical protein